MHARGDVHGGTNSSVGNPSTTNPPKDKPSRLGTSRRRVSLTEPIYSFMGVRENKVDSKSGPREKPKIEPKIIKLRTKTNS